MPKKLWPFDKSRRRQQQHQDLPATNSSSSTSTSRASSAAPPKDNNNNSQHYATSLESTLGAHSKHSSKSGNEDDYYERERGTPRIAGESSSSSIVNERSGQATDNGGKQAAATTTTGTASSSTSNVEDNNGNNSGGGSKLVDRLFHGKRWLRKEAQKAASNVNMPELHPSNSQLSYVSNIGGTNPADEEGLRSLSSEEVGNAAPLVLNRITSASTTTPTPVPLADQGLPLPSAPPGAAVMVKRNPSVSQGRNNLGVDTTEEGSSSISSSRLEPLPTILTINTDNKPVKVSRQRYRNFHIHDRDIGRRKSKHSNDENEPAHHHHHHHHHQANEPYLATPKERCQRVYLSRSQYDSHSSRFRKYIEKRRGELRAGRHHHPHRSHAQEEPEVVTDALIENQRGLLFFNVPFFTSALLLQSDCPAWMTREGQAAPVDIYSAQLPDAMWKWEWSRWYVDMRPDVDEHGWAYSFRFGSTLWHAKPVFFHSFVRRRIWLRQRSRIPSSKACNFLPLENESFLSYAKSHEEPASLGLNTILPTLTTSPTNLMRSRSRDSFYYNPVQPQQQGLTPSVTNLSTTLNLAPTASTIDSVLDNKDETTIISDVPNLMLALRCAFIDRERINAFDEFCQNAGQDLMHLPKVILEVLSTLEFQNSRHQVLDHLVQFRTNAQRNNQFELTRFNGLQAEAVMRALDLAIEEAKLEVGKLDFYADKHHNHGNSAKFVAH